MNPIIRTNIHLDHSEPASVSARQYNDASFVLSRICFLIYMALVLGSFGALIYFLVNPTLTTLFIQIATCLSAYTVKHLGFEHLHFSQCEIELSAGFVEDEDDAEFDQWLDDVGEVETSTDGDVWQKQETRLRLKGIWNEHPHYAQKMSDLQISRPHWLAQEPQPAISTLES